MNNTKRTTSMPFVCKVGVIVLHPSWASFCLASGGDEEIAWTDAWCQAQLQACPLCGYGMSPFVQKSTGALACSCDFNKDMRNKTLRLILDEDSQFERLGEDEAGYQGFDPSEGV